MNKTKFLELVKNPDTIEEKDLTKLDELISEHPYSQIFHILNVKGKKIHNKPDFEQSLNLAATYSYDRALLKSIVDGINFVPETISDGLDTSVPVVEEKELDDVPDFSWIQEGADEDDIFIEDQDDHPSLGSDKEALGEDIFEEHHQTAESENQGPAETEETAKKELEGSDTADEEVSDHLESEPDSKSTVETEAISETTADQDFETDSSTETETTKPEITTEPESDSKEGVESQSEIESAPESESERETESKSESQSEPEGATISSDKDAEELATATSEDDASKDQSSEPTEPTTDPLQAEIAAEGIHAELMQNLSDLKEKRQNFEKKPETNGTAKSQQEQTEIIDNFIKNSPVLSVPNLSADSEGVSQDDLSKSSTKFTDDIASENLAKIYVKQGKRKDAEKIYKKLMVKFPQKKAYFADRIQKLKKK